MFLETAALNSAKVDFQMLNIRSCLATVLALGMLAAELPPTSASGAFKVIVRVDGVEVLECHGHFDTPDPDAVWDDIKTATLRPLPAFQTLDIPDDVQRTVLRSKDPRGIELYMDYGGRVTTNELRIIRTPRDNWGREWKIDPRDVNSLSDWRLIRRDTVKHLGEGKLLYDKPGVATWLMKQGFLPNIVMPLLLWGIYVTRFRGWRHWLIFFALSCCLSCMFLLVVHEFEAARLFHVFKPAPTWTDLEPPWHGIEKLDPLIPPRALYEVLEMRREVMQVGLPTSIALTAAIFLTFSGIATAARWLRDRVGEEPNQP